jgi:prevent-host-death family protein
MTSREFNQDTGGAKKAAEDGPVIITDRGKPAHVLMTFEDYVKLSGKGKTIVDLLSATPGVGDIDFEIPRDRSLPKPATFD